jgi:hypothetical protein
MLALMRASKVPAEIESDRLAARAGQLLAKAATTAMSEQGMVGSLDTSKSALVIPESCAT